MALTCYIRSLRKRVDLPSRLKSLLLLIAPFLAFLLHICLGKYQLSPTLIPSLFLEELFGSSSTPTAPRIVLFNIRLPRAIMAALFGATMGITGASLQSILKNPLVSPYTLGISSGAAFGAALSIALGFERIGYGLLIEPSAFSFALLAVFVAASISRVRGEFSPISMVLAGVIVTAMFQGLLTLVQLTTEPERAQAIVGWISGRLNAVTWSHVLLSIPSAAVGIVGIALSNWRIFVLSTGDEEARALGVNVKRERAIIITLASLATASVVAVAGIIGWVCLIAPHLTRLMVGSNPKKLLLASLSLGATFLLVADAIAKSVWIYEIPVGVIATMVGAPLFLYLMRRSMHAWGG